LKTSRYQRAAGNAALLLVIAAGIFGRFQSRSNDFLLLQKVFSEKTGLEAKGEFYKFQSDSNLIAIGTAMGYGGQVRTAVSISDSGEILQIKVISHKETPSYMQKVIKSRFPEKLLHKKYNDVFQLNKNLDGVSGATYTSRAIATGAGRAAGKFAARILGKEIQPEIKPVFSIGLIDIVLLILLVLGIFARRPGFRHTKPIRWLSLLTGIVVVGFICNKPLVLAHINRILLGYWPQIHTEIYIYILLIGFVLILLFTGKNPYCNWICPFGGVQECIGIIGQAKTRLKLSSFQKVRWITRLLVLTAVIFALVSQNPGRTSYEIFGVFFRLIGETWQFILLGIVIIFSLFIRQPWCRYLCPVKPFEDLIRLIRRLLKKQSSVN